MLLLIDGASLHAATNMLGIDVDFERFRGEFATKGSLLRAIYYTLTVSDGEAPLRPLLDWLGYNGFKVVAKPIKRFADGSGQVTIKANISVELTIDAIELAPRLDHVVLISGDGNLRALVELLQRRGVRVTVVSTISMVSDRLRRQADEFIDLADLRSKIQSESPRRRPAR
ncbi:LabA-like NYN domain-containing protein [Bradyrhizobium cenepequi]